ncbi:MAG TPA: hypothetical protein VFA06_04470 [Actinocrinis sp.]|uniref:hypothetical protein n=1 Tax=Actinocrinis sp. TaxID=1920516 RepID=UPI002D6AE59F|nr:hypothetical protein [Actinocrinis sp.]HZU55099.1 hypothetical protein [Actinocrinis sp.]
MGAAAVAVGAVVWMAWPARTDRAPAPATARAFVDFTVCVLTDAHGISSADAAPVWRGVLMAQESTNAKAQFLAVTGGGSPDAAVVSLNTLALRGCGLIVAVGDSQVSAVWRQARTFPARHFAVVGGLMLAEDGNVAVIESRSPDTVVSQVAALARNAVAGRFASGPVS